MAHPLSHFDGWECRSNTPACEAGQVTCPWCAWSVEEDWFEEADEAALAEYRSALMRSPDDCLSPS